MMSNLNNTPKSQLSKNPKDNYNASKKLYDPTTPDHRVAVKATPVAKAMGNKYYPSKIDVKVKDGKLLNIPCRVEINKIN